MAHTTGWQPPGLALLSPGGFRAAHALFLRASVCLRDICTCTAHIVICMLSSVGCICLVCCGCLSMWLRYAQCVTVGILILQVPITGPLLARTNRNWLARVEWHRTLSGLSPPALCVWPDGHSLHWSFPAFVAWRRSCFISLRICLRDHMCTCTASHACYWMLFVFSLCVVCCDCVVCCGRLLKCS